jgi:predicted RNA-binding protein YlxR (DUF448 family)
MSTHQPIRTCIGCGQKKIKYELLRIVRTPEKKLEIDLIANKPGRGAYLCYDANCLKTAIRKKRIQHHLKIIPSLEFYEEISKVLDERDEWSN